MKQLDFTEMRVIDPDRELLKVNSCNAFNLADIQQ